MDLLVLQASAGKVVRDLRAVGYTRRKCSTQSHIYAIPKRRANDAETENL
jgi:hypothetical protein